MLLEKLRMFIEEKSNFLRHEICIGVNSKFIIGRSTIVEGHFIGAFHK